MKRKLTKEEKREKIKNFLKDHKWEIIVSILGATTGIIFLNRSLVKYKKESEELERQGKEILKVLEDCNRKAQIDPWTTRIDEEIFTDLAPEIEDMVLNKGLEKGWIERTYELGKVGKRRVEVNIEKVA